MAGGGTWSVSSCWVPTKRWRLRRRSRASRRSQAGQRVSGFWWVGHRPRTVRMIPAAAERPKPFLNVNAKSYLCAAIICKTISDRYAEYVAAGCQVNLSTQSDGVHIDLGSQDRLRRAIDRRATRFPAPLAPPPRHLLHLGGPLFLEILHLPSTPPSLYTLSFQPITRPQNPAQSCRSLARVLHV